MNDFFLCLNAILPMFLIIITGYAAKRAGFIRMEDVPAMNKVAFKVFMPAMCFYNVYQSDLSSAIRPQLLAFSVVWVLLSFGASLAYALLFVKERSRKGVVIQGLYRSNFLILGLSFVSGLTGGEDLGSVSVTAAVVVPLFNVLAVTVLEVFNGKKPNPLHLLRDIAKNPLILGSVAGAVFLFLGIGLPNPLELALRDLSRAASPLLLFLLGAFFRFNGVGEHLRELVAVCLGRLVVIPGVVLSVAALMGFRDLEFATLLAIFASSTAANSFTMAQQMGGDASLAGDIVVMTSLFCSVTLFCWTMLFMALGVL